MVGNWLTNSMSWWLRDDDKNDGDDDKNDGDDDDNDDGVRDDDDVRDIDDNQFTFLGKCVWKSLTDRFVASQSIMSLAMNDSIQFLNDFLP